MQNQCIEVNYRVPPTFSFLKCKFSFTSFSEEHSLSELFNTLSLSLFLSLSLSLSLSLFSACLKLSFAHFTNSLRGSFFHRFRRGKIYSMMLTLTPLHVLLLVKMGPLGPFLCSRASVLEMATRASHIRTSKIPSRRRRRRCFQCDRIWQNFRHLAIF